MERAELSGTTWMMNALGADGYGALSGAADAAGVAMPLVNQVLKNKTVQKWIRKGGEYRPQIGTAVTAALSIAGVSAENAEDMGEVISNLNFSQVETKETRALDEATKSSAGTEQETHYNESIKGKKEYLNPELMRKIRKMKRPSEFVPIDETIPSKNIPGDADYANYGDTPIEMSVFVSTEGVEVKAKQGERTTEVDITSNLNGKLGTGG